jgi:UDP-glucose:(heptosyl)LPS alpha-1,3-glucosyltransferase
MNPTSPMRIALVVHDYDKAGGHSRYVAELAEHFAGRHEVHVFANTFGERPPEGVVAHRVVAWRASALTTIFTFLLPATLVTRRRFDIVHAQGLSALGADVVTAHICNRAWFNALKREGGSNWKVRLFDALVVPLERRLFAANAHVIAVSDTVRRDLREQYGRSQETTVIHHGVDLSTFSPDQRTTHRAVVRASLGLTERDLACLFVGDLRKGAQHVIRALASLTTGLSNGSGSGAETLLLVSRTDPEPYRQLAKALGVSSRVRFLDATSTVERYYAAADLFVFPTPYDAFGMVVAEAMASGLPVIVSRAAGAAELVATDVDGIVLDDPDDVEAIARSVRTLAGDEALRQRLGKAAAQKMRDHSWARVAARTLDVYDHLLATGHVH